MFLDNDGVICLSDNWGSRGKKQKKWANEGGTLMIKDMPVEYRFDNFDLKAVKILNEILEETGVEIVVSSDWRYHANLEELGDYYESQGILKRPISVTEVFNYNDWLEEGFIQDHDNFRWSRQEDLEQRRHFEIKKWLRDHPEVSHWVAVDDLNMGKTFTDWRGDVERSWGLENFVLTPRSREGIKQNGVKEKIIKYLI